MDPVITSLGLSDEIARMQGVIAEWSGQSHPVMRVPLEWQLNGGAKYFRPATIFACFQAVADTGSAIPPRLHRAAAALELFHNVSLIIDDILDRSRYRRGKLTLHCRFGTLPALMTAGYTVAGALRSVTAEPDTVDRLCELLERLGVAECVQWDTRREPGGVEAWRELAAQDTGSMFEICGCLATRDDSLRKFGRLLGMLYHGCDDVGDVRGAQALGGGGTEDMRDGILTLPAAIAIQDPEVMEMFASGDPAHFPRLQHAYEAALEDAEAELDAIRNEALLEVELLRDRNIVREPAPLHALIQHTRALSQR